MAKQVLKLNTILRELNNVARPIIDLVVSSIQSLCEYVSSAFEI